LPRRQTLHSLRSGSRSGEWLASIRIRWPRASSGSRPGRTRETTSSSSPRSRGLALGTDPPGVAVRVETSPKGGGYRVRSRRRRRTRVNPRPFGPRRAHLTSARSARSPLRWPTSSPRSSPEVHRRWRGGATHPPMLGEGGAPLNPKPKGIAQSMRGLAGHRARRGDRVSVAGHGSR
jgi:hypothetical protein